ncbi:MAG: hypothetical protein SGARI_005765, partial [Bacillariaceae sp.]
YDYDARKYIVVGKRDKVVDGISTIIFCTGYRLNTEMLTPELQLPYEQYKVGEILPPAWEMTSKYNTLEPYMRKLALDPNAYLWPEPKNPGKRSGLYRDTFLPSNPNMMFLWQSLDDQYPLLMVDVKSRLIANSLVPGGYSVPGTDYMIQGNKLELREQMDVATLRPGIDWEFRKADYDEKYGDEAEESYENRTNRATQRKDAISPTNKGFEKVLGHKYRNNNAANGGLLYHMTQLDRVMGDGGYGIRFFDRNVTGYGRASLNQLTDVGKRWYVVMKVDWSSRGDAEVFKEGNSFHDVSVKRFHSVYTGIPAVPLKKKWMELEEDAYAYAEGICPQLDDPDDTNCLPRP